MAQTSRRPKVKVQAPPRVKTTVLLSPDIYACLQAAALVEKVDQSDLVEHLLAPLRSYYAALKGPSVFAKAPRAGRMGDGAPDGSGPSNDRPEAAGEITPPALPAA